MEYTVMSICPDTWIIKMAKKHRMIEPDDLDLCRVTDDPEAAVAAIKRIVIL